MASGNSPSAAAKYNPGARFTGGNSSLGRMFPKSVAVASSMQRSVNEQQAWLSVTTAIWPLWQADQAGGSELAAADTLVLPLSSPPPSAGVPTGQGRAH